MESKRIKLDDTSILNDDEQEEDATDDNMVSFFIAIDHTDFMVI